LISSQLISVIITSYNSSACLRLVLAALERQTDRAFEVIIADDGSNEQELASIRQIMASCHFPVQMVWQEDQGFRAAKARNRAVVQAVGDYLVFLDGDCIARPDFIAQHRALAEPGYWVPGNRILLSKNFTQGLFTADQAEFCDHLLYWCYQRWRGACNRCLPLFRWPRSWGRKQCLTRWQGAKTCNLGVWKQDFLGVNGFDERYQGWGYEDSDFVIRLIRSSIYRKSGRFAIPVFHCWHPENNRTDTEQNLARLNQVMSSDAVSAALGVDQYQEMRSV
jgi:glycosyltransferase involved in cell wall biosynthesis